MHCHHYNKRRPRILLGRRHFLLWLAATSGLVRDAHRALSAYVEVVEEPIRPAIVVGRQSNVVHAVAAAVVDLDAKRVAWRDRDAWYQVRVRNLGHAVPGWDRMDRHDRLESRIVLHGDVTVLPVVRVERGGT
jgi:hypothetical protein